MIAALLVAALLQGASDHDAAIEALDAGAWSEAWELASAIEGDVERQRARAAILARAGDLTGALAAAREGLDRAPEHLELLFHATSSALALRAGATAERYAERLRAAIGASDLAPEHQTAWQAVADDFVERAGELRSAEAERARALARARGVSGSALTLVATALFVGGFSRASERDGRTDRRMEA